MPEDALKVTYDKFTFLVPHGLQYSDAGVWVKREGLRVRVGLSDFAQQQNGDVAFVRLKPVGTPLQPGDEFAEIETVKVNVSLPAPLAGTIAEINPALEEAAELINQDPYGRGWLAVVEMQGAGPVEGLLDAHEYAARVKEQAEAEMKS